MNEFSEEFVFTTSFYMYAEKGQPAKYHCDVNLKKKSTPVIVKKKRGDSKATPRNHKKANR